MPVGELLRRVSSKELLMWQLYFEEEPVGYDIENWRFAMLAGIFASAFRKKGSKKVKLADYLPKLKKRILPGDEEDAAAKRKPGEPEIFGDPL